MFSLQFWALVTTKVQLNLKSEASRSYLSYLWWIFEPALFVAVLYLVFGTFLARGTPNFVVFLMCGQIPFLWFARTTSNSCGVFEQAAGLMSQIQINKLFFPFVVVVQDAIKSCFVFLLLLIFVAIYLDNVSVHWLAILVVMLVQLFFVTAVALLCSMIIPFIPDMRFLVTTGIQLVMFGSGIFYSYADVIMPRHQSYFLANPVANLINQYRSILIQNTWPDWTALAIILAASVLSIAGLSAVLRKLDGVYPRVVVQ